MEERIRFIDHRGYRVLVVDISHCTAEQVAKIASEVPQHLSEQPPESVLLLADFTGSKFDKDSMAALKQATVFDRPHLKRSAWVGTETLPKIFYENIKMFSRRKLPTFATRQEALDWLVEAKDEQATIPH